ncbi:hypothetical protein CTRI78_v008890 [Colletotrichum trifolii]|uniref:Uncharacterized protein n=1 Tax=Colletotrichum trifolii TaxID=5466 RepID=A0A4R8QYX2_COLTR|nr:hypothetical protein CTRI78_v008890 [Colletotrichum trifolii]
MACDDSCEVHRFELEPNPDVGGIGVLVGFLGTAWLVVILVVIRYVLAFNPYEDPLHDPEQDATHGTGLWLVTGVASRVRRAYGHVCHIRAEAYGVRARQWPPAGPLLSHPSEGYLGHDGWNLKLRSQIRMYQQPHTYVKAPHIDPSLGYRTIPDIRPRMLPARGNACHAAWRYQQVQKR